MPAQHSGANNTLRVPLDVKSLKVFGAEFIADIRHRGLGLECRRKAVGQVAADGKSVLGSEGPFGDAQNVKFHGGRMGGLVLVDAVQVRQQGDASRACGVQLLGFLLSVVANAERAKQLVGFQQFGAEHLRQFTLGQTAHHFHLKQPILCVQVTQRPVQVGFVECLNVRHAPVVKVHAHGRAQLL